MRNSSRRSGSLGLLLVCASSALWGQNGVHTDSVQLGEVVVSASRHATLRKEASTLVKVIDKHMFDNVNGSCLADGLEFSPGVRINLGCRNCGKMEARINGLDGRYTQVLVDSRPLFLSSGNAYALEQIPANLIERVEVIRGGSSALFGAAAIGGTLNVITRQPKKSEAEVSHSLLSIGNSNKFENVTDLNASLVSPGGKAGLSIYAQNRRRQGYDRNGDGYTEITMLKTNTLGLRAFLNAGPQHSWNAHLYHIDDDRRGGNKLSLPAHEANVAEQTAHDIYGGMLDYAWHSIDFKNHFSLSAIAQHQKRNSYYGGTMGDTETERADALKDYGVTTDMLTKVEGQYYHHFDRLWLMPATLTIGADFTYSKLKDRSLWYGTTFLQQVRTGGAYVQNEWKRENLTLLAGCRLDRTNLLSGVVASPSISARYSPEDAWNLRFGYAEGYRSPQYFEDDLHAKLIGGNTVRTRLIDGLREERSHSWSASVGYTHPLWGVPVDILLEGFYTQLNHPFVDTYTTDAAGSTILQRGNGSKARVYGLNAEGNVRPATWMSLQLGATLQRAVYDSPQAWSDNASPETRLLRSPNFYSYFTLRVAPKSRWQVVVTGRYTGGMLVPHSESSGSATDVVVHSPSFFELGWKASYDLPEVEGLKMQVSVGMHNLFDVYQKDLDSGYQRDSEYVYGPSMPRSAYVSLKIGI